MTPTTEQIAADEAEEREAEVFVDAERQACDAYLIAEWPHADPLSDEARAIVRSAWTERAVRQREAADEADYVIDKLSKLLAEIAIITKGPELPLQRHSYHDLPAIVAQAVHIADEAMLELLHSEGAWNIKTGVYGLCDDAGAEVATIEDASPTLREAIDWLRSRGLIEVGQDEHGTFVRVREEIADSRLCTICGLGKHVAAHRPLLWGPNTGEPLGHAFASPADAAGAPDFRTSTIATPGCNCPGIDKLPVESHAPNCPYRAAGNCSPSPVEPECDGRISRAYQAHGGIWPSQLTSGVMFYEGLRITRAQFVAGSKP